MNYPDCMWHTNLDTEPCSGHLGHYQFSLTKQVFVLCQTGVEIWRRLEGSEGFLKLVDPQQIEHPGLARSYLGLLRATAVGRIARTWLDKLIELRSHTNRKKAS